MDLLRLIKPQEIPSTLQEAVDAKTLAQADEIVTRVRSEGLSAVREYAEKFGDIEPGGQIVYTREDLASAARQISVDQRELLERTAARIRNFANSQRESLREMRIAIPGGEAGHFIAPVERAGCYAPGGRFPLVSSVLMTAVTAAAAGVPEVAVASPRPNEMIRAAAFIAGAECLYAVGGAHAIALLAYGAKDVRPCDVVVGPGNPWVTAAKKIVSGRVGIDMLAGPSELTVFADDSADPSIIAADLLAQAEHGYDSMPVLVTTHAPLVESVNAALLEQVKDLPTRETAEASLGKGFAIVASSSDEAVACIDRIAPEHLEVICQDAETTARRFKHYGGIFIGQSAAEVLGDYGAGPNHTLPTGGTARYTGGLSVFDFLRTRTWMRIDKPDEACQLVEDARDLARLEALEAHARSAEKRLGRQ